MSLNGEVFVDGRAVTQTADSVDAAALGRLAGYLKKAGPHNESDDLIARDAFVTAFRMGAAWAIRTCTGLSTTLAQPDLRDGLIRLTDLLSRLDESHE